MLNSFSPLVLTTLGKDLFSSFISKLIIIMNIKTTDRIVAIILIINCLVLFCAICANAQTTVTIDQTPISITDLGELHVSSNVNATFVRIKGSRVIVVNNVTVSHPTKEGVIANFIGNCESYKLDAMSDFVHNRLSLTNRRRKHLAIDGKIANIASTYTIYVPQGMLIRKG